MDRCPSTPERTHSNREFPESSDIDHSRSLSPRRATSFRSPGRLGTPHHNPELECIRSCHSHKDPWCIHRHHRSLDWFHTPARNTLDSRSHRQCTHLARHSESGPCCRRTTATRWLGRHTSTSPPKWASIAQTNPPPFGFYPIPAWSCLPSRRAIPIHRIPAMSRCRRTA